MTTKPQSTTELTAPEQVTLWICCHCQAPRMAGLTVCERCGKKLHDVVEYQQSPASAAPVVGHHKHCSSWTVTTSGEKKPCDCVCECTHSMFQHIRPGEHYWYEACAVGGCPCMKFSTAAATPAPQQSDDRDAARVQRLEAQMQGLLNSLATSQQEVERLRAGNFTPQEFQNLCHNLDESDREVFVAGCLEYQRKLFGDSAAPVEQSDRCGSEKENGQPSQT